MENGSCHLWPLQNPSKRSHGMQGSSEDVCMHSLKIMMICLTIIMEPGMKLYSKRTKHLPKKFMCICNQLVNMSGQWIWWTSLTHKRCMQRHKKRIDVTTAQRWMKKLNYHWTLDLKGQYVDGHERGDIIAYWQHVFLLAWKWAQLRS